MPSNAEDSARAKSTRGAPPNILQITTHDSGRFFGCYGYPSLHTPSIDGLAADGVRFAQYFATVPICSASRATQLTGLYPQRHGLLDLVSFGWRIEDERRHLSHLLKAAGYQTRLFGVQHEVTRQELGRLAFDEVVGSSESAETIADSVAAFLRSGSAARQPFYAQIGFVQTHSPFGRGGVCPDTSKGIVIPPYIADTESARSQMAAFQGAIRHVDSAVGRILSALRDSGMEDDTIVVFTTDHGIEMPRAKWFLYDPGIAIGLIMRYPRGGVTGGRCCELLSGNVDYLPTLLELAGLETPAGLDGRSFARAMLAEDPAPVRDEIFALYHKNQTRCVRTSRFKLVRHFDAASDFHTIPVNVDDTLNKRVIPPVELFDLEADPNEFKNLSNQPEYAETRNRLDDRLWAWLESTGDPILQGPVRSPSYDAALQDYATWKGAKKG